MIVNEYYSDYGATPFRLGQWNNMIIIFKIDDFLFKLFTVDRSNPEHTHPLFPAITNIKTPHPQKSPPTF